MDIGINASAAVRQPRTGVEEYAYQLIKHLTMLPEAGEHRFLLYLPAKVSRAQAGLPFDFPLPENFEIKILKWGLPMWTQIRLASQLFFNRPDALFIPVHILPRFHPVNSVVTIHGLEYEYYPEYYPIWFRNYLRYSTTYAVRHARKVIAVSENTKQDLIKLYGAKESDIEVLHHGIQFSITKSNAQSHQSQNPYLLYIGRLELKKNILGILEAFQILKEKYKIPHDLILAGAPGFGYGEIKFKIKSLKSRVKELGYVTEERKQQLLSGADIFVFPSFYEGFGLPILEAQAAGLPVISSKTSSIPEVTGNSVLLVDPKNIEQIADTVHKLIDDKPLRDRLIQLGFQNIKRFSWEVCARETLKIIVEK
jgi:glycosyltransferase involved in cell wall biosynthesis